jgi:hypothetical protein
VVSFLFSFFFFFILLCSVLKASPSPSPSLKSEEDVIIHDTPTEESKSAPPKPSSSKGITRSLTKILLVASTVSEITIPFLFYIIFFFFCSILSSLIFSYLFLFFFYFFYFFLKKQIYLIYPNFPSIL